MKRILNRVFFRLYNATLPPKNWREGMGIGFNLQGHNYYIYEDFSKLPPERLKRYQQYLSMIDKGFDPTEYTNMVGLAEHLAQNCLDDMNQKRKLDSMQSLIYTIQELKSRKDDILFHPHLVMEIAALVILRDDEKVPNEINEEIHAEKARLFLVHGGSLDFFTTTGIEKFVPSLKDFLGGFKEQLEIAQKQLRLSRTTFQTIAGEVGYLK